MVDSLARGSAPATSRRERRCTYWCRSGARTTMLLNSGSPGWPWEISPATWRSQWGSMWKTW